MSEVFVTHSVSGSDLFVKEHWVQKTRKESGGGVYVWVTTRTGDEVTRYVFEDGKLNKR